MFKQELLPIYYLTINQFGINFDEPLISPISLFISIMGMYNNELKTEIREILKIYIEENNLLHFILYLQKYVELTHYHFLFDSDENSRSSTTKTISFSKDIISSEINGWISLKTNNLINLFIDPKKIHKKTEKLVIDTVYFNKKWKYKFNETKERIFKFSDNRSKFIPMIQLEASFNYLENKDFQFIEIPLENNLFMGIINFKGTPGSIENILNDIDLMMPKNINLEIPKFDLEHQTDLTRKLKILGLKKSLKHNQLIHKVIVKIDNGNLICPISGNSKDIIIDHSFSYYVRDVHKLFLLTGKFLN